MEKKIIEMEQHIEELKSALILMYQTMKDTELFKKLHKEMMDLEYKLEIIKRAL